MSRDWVVLADREPDVAAVAAVSGTEVTDAAWPVRLFDRDGRLVVSVEEPVFVAVRGEIDRLLGVSADRPVWWVDVRAAAGPPEAGTAARGVATALAGRLGGRALDASGASR